MNTRPLGPFLGINNRLPDFALRRPFRPGEKGGDYLPSASDVDVTNAGSLRRRRATAQVQAMANAHSLRMTSATAGFLVRASALYAVTLPTYTETLLKVLTSDAAMSYTQLGDSWYFSNGTDRGRVTAGVAYPMGLPTPDAPALAAIGGSLTVGWYQVSVAYVNAATGEEGGVSPSGNYELTAQGGLRVTLPAATAGASHINVYLSDPNGTAPALHQSVAVGTASLDLTSAVAGRPAPGRFENILPAGKLFVANGRLCSYAAGMVYVGLPYRPGYYQPADGYIPFPADVSVVVPNQGGVFIAADKTYWVPGDLGDVKDQIRDVLPYGAVPGTDFAFPDQPKVGWFGAKGIVFGSTDGSVEAVMADNIDLVPPAIGTAVVLECDGERRVVSCGWCVNLENKAATTYTGWDFTSVSGDYGTHADGIYATNATGGAVNASIGLGKNNFGAEQKKRLPEVCLGIDSLSTMSVRIQAPGGIDYSYTSQRAGAGVQMQRIVPGKGLLASWFDLTLTNSNGGEFTLATVSFAPVVTSRRV